MSNSAMPGYLKVGRTTDHYLTRAAQLRTTGVPSAFKVEFALEVSHCDRLEKRVHGHLRAHRTSRNREFFTVGLSEAVQALERGISELRMSVLDTLDPTQERVKAKKIEKKRTAAELNIKRARLLTVEAQEQIAFAKKPLHEAIEKTRFLFDVLWALACALLIFLAYISLDRLELWAWILALLVYFFGRILPMAASIFMVDRMPWGRGLQARQQAEIAAIEARRDQAIEVLGVLS